MAPPATDKDAKNYDKRIRAMADLRAGTPFKYTQAQLQRGLTNANADASPDATKRRAAIDFMTSELLRMRAEQKPAAAPAEKSVWQEAQENPLAMLGALGPGLAEAGLSAGSSVLTGAVGGGVVAPIEAVGGAISDATGMTSPEEMESLLGRKPTGSFSDAAELMGRRDVRAVHSITDPFTYQPKTLGGRAIMSTLGLPQQGINAVGGAATQAAQAAGASPGWASLVGAGAELPLDIGLSELTAGAGRGVARAAGRGSTPAHLIPTPSPTAAAREVAGHGGKMTLGQMLGGWVNEKESQARSLLFAGHPITRARGRGVESWQRAHLNKALEMVSGSRRPKVRAVKPAPTPFTPQSPGAAPPPAGAARPPGGGGAAPQTPPPAGAAPPRRPRTPKSRRPTQAVPPKRLTGPPPAGPGQKLLGHDRPPSHSENAPAKPEVKGGLSAELTARANELAKDRPHLLWELEEIRGFVEAGDLTEAEGMERIQHLLKMPGSSANLSTGEGIATTKLPGTEKIAAFLERARARARARKPPLPPVTGAVDPQTLANQLGGVSAELDRTRQQGKATHVPPDVVAQGLHNQRQLPPGWTAQPPAGLGVVPEAAPAVPGVPNEVLESPEMQALAQRILDAQASGDTNRLQALANDWDAAIARRLSRSPDRPEAVTVPVSKEDLARMSALPSPGAPLALPAPAPPMRTVVRDFAGPQPNLPGGEPAPRATQPMGEPGNPLDIPLGVLQQLHQHVNEPGQQRLLRAPVPPPEAPPPPDPGPAPAYQKGENPNDYRQRVRDWNAQRDAHFGAPSAKGRKPGEMASARPRRPRPATRSARAAPAPRRARPPTTVPEHLSGREAVEFTHDILDREFSRSLSRMKVDIDSTRMRRGKREPSLNHEMTGLRNIINAPGAFADPAALTRAQGILGLVDNAFAAGPRIAGQSLQNLMTRLRTNVEDLLRDRHPEMRRAGQLGQEIQNAIDRALARDNTPEARANYLRARNAWAIYKPAEAASAATLTPEAVPSANRVLRSIRDQDRSMGKGRFARGEAGAHVTSARGSPDMIRAQTMGEQGNQVYGREYPDSGTSGRHNLSHAATHPISTALGAALGIPAAALYSRAGQAAVQRILMRRPRYTGAQVAGAYGRTLPLGVGVQQQSAPSREDMAEVQAWLDSLQQPPGAK
jgi:hypothetical protein